MSKVHPEFEDGYNKGYESSYQFGRESADCSAIKRELAVKVLTEIDDLFNLLASDYVKQDDIKAELMRLFTTEGVVLEGRSDGG